jgi:hypothetical protein
MSFQEYDSKRDAIDLKQMTRAAKHLFRDIRRVQDVDNIGFVEFGILGKLAKLLLEKPESAI